MEWILNRSCIKRGKKDMKKPFAQSNLMKKILFWLVFIPGCLFIMFHCGIEFIDELCLCVQRQMNRFESWCFDDDTRNT